MLFRGHSYRNLDPKGRLMLPPEFRDVLLERSAQGKFVLTIYDGCIVGFPEPDWREFEDKFSRLRNPSRKVRDFRRMMLGGSEEAELDSQGRLRLSKAHMDYAGIARNVALVGQGNRFEIWDEKRFKDILNQSFDDVADELAESGIDLPL